MLAKHSHDIFDLQDCAVSYNSIQDLYLDVEDDDPTPYEILGKAEVASTRFSFLFITRSLALILSSAHGLGGINQEVDERGEGTGHLCYYRAGVARIGGHRR